MTRSRLTGVADAKGHVRGTWFSEQGEKIIGVARLSRVISRSRKRRNFGDAITAAPR